MRRYLGAARRGMTLMELVIALMITGMIAAIGTAAFDSVLAARARVRADVDAVTRASATRAMIAAWLAFGDVSSDAQRPPTVGSLNLDQPDDALLITARAPTSVDYRTVVVHLFIDRDDETPERGLVAELQPAEGQTMVRTVVDSTVTGLLVEYLDPQLNRWIPRSEGAIRGFRATRVTLSAEAPDTLPPLLRLPFVQAVPNFNPRRAGGG
jgi:prepilin-type N-terminal cleavage/methylation domain-containing protein